MGIFQTLKSRGDPIASKVLNEFLKFNARLTEAETSLEFINDCIRTDRYPKTYWKSLRRNKIYPNSRTLKRQAINQTDSLKMYINNLERNLSQRGSTVDNLLPQIKSQFMDYTNMVAKSRSEKLKKKLIQSLEHDKPERKFPMDPERYVHNFSSVTLDRLQLEALSLGPRFCDYRNKINQLDTDVQFENLFTQTTDLVPTSPDELTRFNTTLVDICQQFKNSKYTIKNPLTKQHRDALHILKKDNTLIMSKPDKGGGLVLMDKADYIDKMNSILNDTTKFQKLNDVKDINMKTEKMLTNSLKELKNKEIITPSIHDSLKPTGSNTPRLYGLPKVHKVGLPLRPVLDMYNSPYHKTAKWLVQILEPLHKLVVNKSVKDVFDFISKIEHMNLSGKRMISLDVASLFTNVPLTETIDFVCQQLHEKQINVGIPEVSLKELLLKCTMNVHFVFNNTYYRQIDGIAMGSPLGPILADFFLAKLENGPLKDVINKLDFYCRYVDDTFIIVDQDIGKVELLEQLNNKHQAIKFTCEEEIDNKLNFLDVLLIKKANGSISRSVFRKSSSSSQYTHFLSFVPIYYKRNLVKCLANRARKICSVDSINNELEVIHNMLIERGYPLGFLKKHLHSTNKKVKISTAAKKPLFLKLQFNGDSADDVLRDRLTKAVKRTLNAADLFLSYSTRSMVIPQLKDKLPGYATSMCIYKFSCSCGESYIGRTTRQLNQRVSEHLPSWLGKGMVKSIRSSILSHLIDSGHEVDRNQSFKVIYRIPTTFPYGVRSRLLHIAEAIGIRSNNPSLCVHKKFVTPLSLPWP